jgi:hypothetical protein
MGCVSEIRNAEKTYPWSRGSKIIESRIRNTGSLHSRNTMFVSKGPKEDDSKKRCATCILPLLLE